MKIRKFRYPGILTVIIVSSCFMFRISQERVSVFLKQQMFMELFFLMILLRKKNLDASLASAFTYIKQVRKEKDVTILLDNGDNLQGQPEVYYYNFIDTVSPHFCAEVMNYMGYDAGTVGNHDVEAGHAVYDRLVKEYNFPLLAANAVDIKTGKPYFKPYHIIEKEGIKIAVFGLVTPAIPNWLPQELYSGIEFRDMVETAKIWMPVILNEKPDLVVGLISFRMG